MKLSCTVKENYDQQLLENLIAKKIKFILGEGKFHNRIIRFHNQKINFNSKKSKFHDKSIEFHK